MKTVKLYGELGRIFGRHFEFDVATPAEAVRALCSQIKGFRAYMYAHSESPFKVFVGGRNASLQVGSPCSDSEVIRIAPVVQGAGGLGRIVIGAVLMYFSQGIGGMAFEAGIGASAAAMESSVFMMGASMILGGVIELLSPVQSINSGTEGNVNTGNMPSYNFDGPTNTVAQGHPVPLAYGRIIVGSAVISAGLTT